MKISSATHVRHFLSRKRVWLRVMAKYAIAKNVSSDNSISTR